MPSSLPIELVLVLEDAEADSERLDGDARRLRRELAELEVESVDLASAGEVPPGAKAADMAAIGTLLVTVLPGVLPKVFEVLQSWMQRREGQTVKIRATAGDRTFDVEYSPRAMDQRALGELLASVSRALDGSRGVT